MIRVLLYYLYLFVAWGLYRYFSGNEEWVDEFIAKPLLWLIPIAFIIRYIEKRRLVHGIQLHFNTFIHDIGYGVIGSFVVFAVYIFGLYFKFGTLTFNPLSLTAFTAVVYLGISLATGIVEEITFRGFIFARFVKATKMPHFSNIITTLLFIMIHLPMIFFHEARTLPEFIEALPLIIALSLIDGYLFDERKGLVAPITAHAFWNFISLWVI